jgi:hypothetical protein
MNAIKTATMGLFMTISLCSSTGSAAAETKVFLLAGQSNMAGVGGWSTDKPLPPPYDAPQNNVLFWDKDAWVPLRGGFGHTDKLFGPEVSFGWRLKSLFPKDDIYLVKYGVSATSLAGDWNPSGSGACYNTFKAKVAAAMKNLAAAGRAPKIAGMIWMQGESDAKNPAWAPAYRKNLTDFIAAARKDFDAPKMTFVAGRIRNTWGAPADNAAVRKALETIPRLGGNGAWIDTDDLQLAYDGHYGTQGQLDLGLRFADEFNPQGAKAPYNKGKNENHVQ